MNILNESCYKKINLFHVPTETAKSIYNYALWTGHFDCKRDFYIKRTHTSYLLLYTLRGSGRLNYQGASYTLGEGSLLLLDCSLEQEYYPEEQGWEFKYIHFLGISKGLYNHIGKIYGTPICKGAQDTEKYFDKVISAVKNKSSEALISRYIYRILTDAAAQGEGVFSDQSTSAKIKQALDYIADNYAGALSISSLSKMCHLSRCYFSVEFKRQTGMSPYAYLLSYRIEAAKHMLLTSSSSTEEIAEKCGFSEPSVFIRAFKVKTGVTPYAFRKGNTARLS